VAQHAAQPGDPVAALKAVLQLTTLLAGAPWAALLLPDETGDLLRLGPTSGLNRRALERLGQLTLEPSDFGLGPPFSETETAHEIELPPSIQQTVSETEGVIFALSNGQRLVGVLLVGGPSTGPIRRSLMTGIAHQISLRIENARLIMEAAAQKSLERELATARGIQESFLPEDMPSGDGWDVGAIWVAARKVGGDFYDFIPLPDGPEGPRWGIAIADVADKGVPAALFMALCRTLLRSIAGSFLEPGAALTRLNQLIFAETRPDLFLSLFYAVWEPQTARVIYANGGHNPPLVRGPGRQVDRILNHNMLLGVDAKASYLTYDLRLPTGGVLLLYTDGVTEAFGPAGNQFGLDNLEQLLQAAPDDLTAQALTNLVANAVADFSAEPEPFDDLTAVALRRHE
jgi:sigma-B regulation protein RsbU (phosphoserine phosphatase)